MYVLSLIMILCTQTLADKTIKNQCTSVILSLPSIPDLDDDEISDEAAFALALTKCIQRFLNLEAQHRKNIDAFSAKMKRPPLKPSIKRRLLVLDLDETLVSKRANLLINCSKDLDFAYMQIGEKYNMNALKMSLQPKEDEFILGIFRPKVMELIRKYNVECDFVLYTAATSKAAMYYVVMIEMYYNHWYTNTKKMRFHFKSAIFRLPHHYNSKSIHVLSKVMNLQSYKQIAIIDDLLYSTVWDLRHNEDEFELRGHEIRPWHMGFGDKEVNVKIDKLSLRYVFDAVMKKYDSLNDTELINHPNVSLFGEKVVVSRGHSMDDALCHLWCDLNCAVL